MIRRQVTEIPPVRAEVTEHQMIGRRCGCGTVTWGKAPAGVTAPAQYGPRAAALGTYLWHGQFLSRDRARAALAGMFGCAPSPGALAAMSRKIAGLIAPALDAIARALLAAEVAHFEIMTTTAERAIRMSKLRIKVSGCMRSTTGAEAFCAIRSYLATASRHDISWLDALTRAVEGSPWIPGTS